MPSIADIRTDYKHGALDDEHAAADPFDQFSRWWDEALRAEVLEPNAMTLASADAEGRPAARTVLLKGFDAQGFVFYTNYESRKGQHLLAHPKAALLFHWKSLRRQVRVRGTISVVTDAEADAYFATRPKDAQIGAWASAQSRPMHGRFEFEKEIARYAAKYALSKVDRPPHWSGFRVTPLEIEFWRDRRFRLHDRVVYRRASADAPWAASRLYP